MKLAIWKTDYGRGPRKLFLVNGFHSVTIGEFVRHPIKALRVLVGKAGEGA